MIKSVEFPSLERVLTERSHPHLCLPRRTSATEFAERLNRAKRMAATISENDATGSSGALRDQRPRRVNDVRLAKLVACRRAVQLYHTLRMEDYGSVPNNRIKTRQLAALGAQFDASHHHQSAAEFRHDCEIEALGVLLTLPDSEEILATDPVGRARAFLVADLLDSTLYA